MADSSAHISSAEPPVTAGSTSTCCSPTSGPPGWHALDGATLGHYQRLAVNVLSDFPGRVPASLLFAAIEEETQSAVMLAQVARMLAQRVQSPVALIDAHGGPGSLSQRFQLQAKPGLSDVLSDRGRGGEWVVELDERVRVLPAGSEPLDSFGCRMDALFDLLAALKQDYRFVLVDAGRSAKPMAQWFSRLCEATYFLVRLGRTDTAETSEALQRFRSSGIRLLGCLVTDVSSV